MKHLTWIFLLTLALPIHAHDSEGVYTSLGLGTVSCTTAAGEMAGSEQYGAFVTGYLTAMNAWLDNNLEDLAFGTDVQRITLWLQEYCGANPEKNLADAMSAVAVELARLQTPPAEE